MGFDDQWDMMEREKEGEGTTSNNRVRDGLTLWVTEGGY
jgi:hypothetical protein